MEENDINIFNDDESSFIQNEKYSKNLKEVTMKISKINIKKERKQFLPRRTESKVLKTISDYKITDKDETLKSVVKRIMK